MGREDGGLHPSRDGVVAVRGVVIVALVAFAVVAVVGAIKIVRSCTIAYASNH